MRDQRLVSAVVVVLTLWAAPSAAGNTAPPVITGARAAGERPSAIEWGGRYPFDGPGGLNLFDLPWVRAKLTALVGGKRYEDTLRAWNSSVPILTEANDLLIQGCDPADCRRNMAVLIENTMALVCIHDGVRLIWYVAPTTPPLIRMSEGVKDSGCAFRSLALARAQLLMMQRRTAGGRRRRAAGRGTRRRGLGAACRVEPRWPDLRWPDLRWPDPRYSDTPPARPVANL